MGACFCADMPDITAKEIEWWASRFDAPGDLPWLIRRLVRSTCLVQACSIGDREETRHGGYDGQVEVLDAGLEDLVPAGRSVWEMSTDEKVKRKANDDFRLRTDARGADINAERTFVFVSPRGWGDRDEWVAERKAEGKWRDVLGLNSKSLQKWMESAPAIAGMFCQRCLRRDPGGLATAEMMWDDCAKNIDLVYVDAEELSAEYVIAGREQQARAIADWISRAEPREGGSTLRVFGPSLVEAEHFVAAVVSSMAQEWREQLNSSMVWIRNGAGAREISWLHARSIVVTSTQYTTRAAELGRTYGCRVMLLRQGTPVIDPAPGTVSIPHVSLEERIRQLCRLGCDPRTAAEVCRATDGDYARLRHEVFLAEDGGAN